MCETEFFGGKIRTYSRIDFGEEAFSEQSHKRIAPCSPTAKAMAWRTQWLLGSPSAGSMCPSRLSGISQGWGCLHHDLPPPEHSKGRPERHCCTQTLQSSLPSQREMWKVWGSSPSFWSAGCPCRRWSQCSSSHIGDCRLWRSEVSRPRERPDRRPEQQILNSRIIYSSQDTALSAGGRCVLISDKSFIRIRMDRKYLNMIMKISELTSINLFNDQRHWQVSRWCSNIGSREFQYWDKDFFNR